MMGFFLWTSIQRTARLFVGRVGLFYMPRALVVGYRKLTASNTVRETSSPRARAAADTKSSGT